MNKALTLSRRSLFLGSSALAGAGLFPAAFAANGMKIKASIDAQQQGDSISPMMYGGFIEHIGNLINHSLWSEVLDDRKFYYGVIKEPEEKPADRRAAMRFIQKWHALGSYDAIQMDTSDAYVGQHSPRVVLDGSQERGMTQQGLVLKSETSYDGRIVYRTQGKINLRIRLVDDNGQEQIVKLPKSSKWKTREFKFSPVTESYGAKIEIFASGEGHFSVGAISLMPSDNVEGFRADTLALMKEMHCPILRMPGGNFVSAYDWKDTIGDPDKRPPIFDPVWSAVQPNDVGIDELLRFCELIDTIPFWCVNTGFGEPRSGAECVEYVNGNADTEWGAKRAANGRKQPYKVKYWAIGNEMYGHWQRGHMARDQYTVKHNLFADAMRAVDPDIYIVAPGGFVDEMTTGQGIFVEGQPEVKVGSERDWAYGMFKDSWGKFDALGTHAYPPENKRFNLKTGELEDDIKPLKEWARQPADRIMTMVDAWEQYKKHFPKLNEGNVKVFFDEWAFHFQDDLKGALAIALAFHEFFRHTDFIEMAGFTMATGWLTHNRIKSQLSLKGEIFKFYQQHFGSIPVAVGGNSPRPGPKFPIGGDQPSINPGSPTYPLGLSAALSEDKKILTLAVVDPTEQEHHFAYTLNGFPALAEGDHWVMTGMGPDAKNALGEPAQVFINASVFDVSVGSLRIEPVSAHIHHFKKAGV